MQGGNIKKEYFRDYSLEIQKINYEEIKNTKKFSPINCFFYNVLDFNSTVVSITDCERTRIRKIILFYKRKEKLYYLEQEEIFMIVMANHLLQIS